MAAFSGSQGVPGVILLDNASGSLQSNAASSDFRGWSVSPDGLLQSVETYNAHHAFFAGSNELMRIGERVGIATTSPEATLDVAGDVVVRSDTSLLGATTACNLTVIGSLVSPNLTATSNAAFAALSAVLFGSNVSAYSSNFAYSFANASSNAIFFTSNSHTSTSNAAYGSSNPAFFGSNFAYTFAKASSNAIFFTSNSYFNASNTIYACSNPAFTGSNAAFVASNALFRNFLFSGSNSSGVNYPYVGIGTVSPTYPLHITVPTTTAAISIWVQGVVVSLSDRRIKRDIAPLSGALEKIKAIGGYTYNTGDPTGEQEGVERFKEGTHVGVIAQEVEAVLKQAVYLDKDTGYKSVAYGNLVALVIEAIKEMHDDFDRRLRDLELSKRCT